MRLSPCNTVALPPATSARRPLLFWSALWGMLLIAGLATAQPQPQFQGSVSGRLIGDPAKGSLQGATVMLMWFHTNAQGKPEAGPIARQLAGINGSFTFNNVPIDPKARYQLGTRVDGRLVGSDPFTFAAGSREKKVDIIIPELVEDRSALSISQALYVVEPGIGRVWITEVVHLQNRSENIISTGDTPLELPLPPGAGEVEVIRMEAREGNHQRIGAKLQIFGRFKPGNTTIAFRYALPVLLGGISMEKRYALPADDVLVLAEQGRIEVSGGLLRARPPRKIEEKIYDAWGAADLPAEAAIKFTVSGVPVAQWIFLIPTGFFFIVMAGVVFWFMRKRLAGRGLTG